MGTTLVTWQLDYSKKEMMNGALRRPLLLLLHTIGLDTPHRMIE